MQQYALIENSLAHHEQQGVEAHRREVAALWSRFNEVAQRNPLAAFPLPRTATDIATPGPKNRPLAYPYNKWHASQWTVDQAAALLFCSAERAQAAGVPTDQWIFPHVALHVLRGGHTDGPAEHARLARHGSAGPASRRHAWAGPWPSCRSPRSIRASRRPSGCSSGSWAWTPRDPDRHRGHVVRRRALQQLRAEREPAAVAALLRATPSEHGLITTVSGMLSKPGLAVWSASPPAAESFVADLAGSPEIDTPNRPVAPDDTPGGPAVVASFTVTYDAADPLRPARTAIVADLPDGTRTAATCDDAAIALSALSESLIGQTVHVARTSFSL